MKKWVFILILFTIGINLLLCQAFNDDNYGRINGQVIDPETSLPVKEIFTIVIFPSDDYYRVVLPEVDIGKLGARGIDTNNNGFFSAKYPPGKYDLFIFPFANRNNYKYSCEPFNQQTKLSFEIIKGKITKIRKKASLGGALKIILIDLSGNRINFTTSLKDCVIRIRVENDKNNFEEGYDMNDNDTIIRGIYKEAYRVKINFKGIGFDSLIRDNVLVEPRKTTEVVFTIDPSDITGIEGYVRNQLGETINDAQLTFFPMFESITNMDKKDKTTWTDSKGYFRLTALPPGVYEILVHFKRNNKPFSRDSDSIEIKKSILLKKDLRIFE